MSYLQSNVIPNKEQNIKQCVSGNMLVYIRMNHYHIYALFIITTSQHKQYNNILNEGFGVKTISIDDRHNEGYHSMTQNQYIHTGTFFTNLLMVHVSYLQNILY